MLTLRFFGERTQREIAEELDISQMHVSRLLTRTLTRLRDYFIDDVDLPPEWLDGDTPRERRRGPRIAA
jgi:RNA polymerase sigma-B factor